MKAKPQQIMCKVQTLWASKLGQFDIEEASFYGGMAPPNCLHRYELIVYALDTKLNLKPGFRF